ncbi:response regulator transcription factor [Trichocoleus sp. FACHB-262]|uniref:response regulator transcription factor n=1 Tax=Trichocoleus sp. FACHB-262 TaxID=2692869 RepID=UPI001687EA2D|nr:response regulator transcription factor [Trichocoleus sp. FACHB-262]MBD2123555.1 response regulator transcription factor [Trichocoleus sp. FACHB-262]
MHPQKGKAYLLLKESNGAQSSTQDSSPIILVVEPDDETRPLLKHNLNHQGYRVIIALDAEDAIERMMGGFHCPELILLNQFRQSIEEAVGTGRRIRTTSGIAKDTPIVVIAERYSVDLEVKDMQVGDREYVSYPEDGQQLMNLLQKLCPV